MGSLKDNKTKITAENAFKRDHLWMESNHESKNGDKTFIFGIFADSWAVP